MKLSLPTLKMSIVLKVSLLAASIAAFASLVVGSLIVHGSAEIVYENALSRLKYETNIKALKLVSDIKNLSGDTLYLAGTPPIQGLPRAMANGGVDPMDNSDQETWKARLATIFSELIRAKPSYVQIRYIALGDGGRELVRVHRRGNIIQVVTNNELQRKGDTTYFKNAIKANPGDVYLSDITLNRDFGEISVPHTPVIRAATPIYFNEKIFGILVINMEFSSIFEELINKTPRELVPYVTNEDGYFLAHPDKRLTFGFDLENDNRIQRIYPELKLERFGDIRDSEHTSEVNGDVIHVVKAHYDPMEKQRFFAVMLATSTKHLQSASQQLRTQSVMIMGVLVVISLVVSGLLASRLMRPLKLISKASDDLANGREVGKLPVEYQDEIGELARSFDVMRHQLEEKERELIVSQGRVHHANKLASLGEMAASMAHEINSPIQTINLIAQRVQRQLKKGVDIEDVDSSMSKISASVKKISEIIDSLRKVSRDSTEEHFDRTRIGALVQDVVNMTEERFKVNNLAFKVNYHDGLSADTVIECQRLQMCQVLINLVNNAYDSVRDGVDKWIKINIHKGQDSIILCVDDSGLGVPDEIADRIFEPMFTTKDVGSGTGLGLSISREIVSKHGGRLYLDRAVKHTRFVIEMPMAYGTHKRDAG